MAPSLRVSIHVPLAEHDAPSVVIVVSGEGFNSRAPRGARPGSFSAGFRHCAWFQFTCPSRSTTTASTATPCASPFQFTCPSRSTTSLFNTVVETTNVSIHVPLAEHDGAWQAPDSRLRGFNSRAPRGARPVTRLRAVATSSFNSRAPRGARLRTHAGLTASAGFNSRAPRGARPDFATVTDGDYSVSIHVPLAEHDRSASAASASSQVSIHVPLAEHDRSQQSSVQPPLGFNSRAPRGARPNPTSSRLPQPSVSIHVPLAEHDLHTSTVLPKRSVFQFTCPSRSTTTTS